MDPGYAIVWPFDEDEIADNLDKLRIEDAIEQAEGYLSTLARSTQVEVRQAIVLAHRQATNPNQVEIDKL